MLGRRTAWLGRPWFFVAVVVLALNDHVFKSAWPGWVTGKLSDVAGVVVIATLAATQVDSIMAVAGMIAFSVMLPPELMVELLL